MKLEKKKIEEMFGRLDEAAQTLGMPKMEFFVIGSAVLISHGMEDRATIDVDFWKSNQEDKERLKLMAEHIGIDFDPTDYRYREDPYIQWVSPGFVHMPVEERWKEHAQSIWKGEVIDIKSAPVGVILGSKLAAGREQDIADIRYIVRNFPQWENDLNQWLGDFTTQHQQDAQDNMAFVHIFAKEMTSSQTKKSKL